MTERERLIKLLKRFEPCGYDNCESCHNDCYVAQRTDFLIKNNIVVLPCKVGDIVYKITNIYTECSLGVTPRYEDDYSCVGCCQRCDSVKTRVIDKGKVTQIIIAEDYIRIQAKWERGLDTSYYTINENVWKSYEEAEKALRDDNNE